MDEGAWELLRQSPEGARRSNLMSSEAFVFAPQPTRQIGVHMLPDRRHRRPMEAAIILLPPREDRIEHGRKIGQSFVALQLQMPTPNRLSHGLARRATDRRGEVHIDSAIFVQRFARPERITEKGELDRGMILSTIDILAIHDTCLARMQLESAFPKALVDPLQDEPRLRSALAMNNRIVGVSAKPNAPQMAIHPLVEGIVQEQVRQQRRNHALNAKDNFLAAGASRALQSRCGTLRPEGWRARGSSGE